MNKLTYMITSCLLVISLLGCGDSEKYNKVTNEIKLSEFYQPCLNNVTYILRSTRIDGYKGYMSPKFNTDSKIIFCNPTQQDIEFQKSLFYLCLDNVVYYLRATRIDGYKGFMSPKFNTDSKVSTC